jgi:hypothetical protein
MLGWLSPDQAVRPVTPRASAAAPAAQSEESATGGVLGRVLPAAVLGNRFQHLFKGKGERRTSMSTHFLGRSGRSCEAALAWSPPL